MICEKEEDLPRRRGLSFYKIPGVIGQRWKDIRGHWMNISYLLVQVLNINFSRRNSKFAGRLPLFGFRRNIPYIPAGKNWAGIGRRAGKAAFGLVPSPGITGKKGKGGSTNPKSAIRNPQSLM